MRNFFKRWLAMILCLTTMFNILPMTAFAQSNNGQTSVNTSDVTIEGSNGFGTLLSEEITENQEQAAADAAEYEGGYTVTDLVIEGTTATVTYDSLEEAILIVAIYSEDGMQMMASGTVTISSEETEAVVTIEGDMPDYFMASAYLMDTYDLSPLCASYDTPMYTQEMQELLDSTISDYDPELVLNLDDDNTTNFAVYDETVKIITAQEGVNNVISVDDENLTYVLDNTDEQIRSLTENDIFAYEYAEDEILIVKVTSITLDGDSATIIGQDVDLEDVFSHVKMESAGDTSDIVVDENTGDEGVEYLGNEENIQDDTREANIKSYAADGEIESKTYLNFNIYKEGKTGDTFSVEGKFEAALGVDLDIKLEYYVSLSRKYFKFTTDTELKAKLSATGKATGQIKLKELTFSPNPAIDIKFKPIFLGRFSGELSFDASVGFTSGFLYATDNGFNNLCTSPQLRTELNLEGSFFIGIDLGPQVDIGKEYIASAEASLPIGIEIKGEMKGTDFETNVVLGKDIPDKKHTCSKCLEMNVSAKAEFSTSVTFMKCKRLSLQSDLITLSFSLGKAYWSFDLGTGNWGTCPYHTYRVTASVVNGEGEPVSDASVTVIENSTPSNGGDTTEKVQESTNTKGVAVIYLQEGNYTISGESGEESVKRSIKVNDTCKVKLCLSDKSEDHSIPGIPGTIDTETIIDNSMVKEGIYNNNRYQLFDASMTWTDAKAYCENLGGHLVTITTAEEQTFVQSLMESGSKKQYWIGMYNQDGMTWVTEETVSYTNWDRGEPNHHSSNGRYEDYIHIYNKANPAVSGSQRFKWNDMYVDNIYPGEETFFNTCYVGFICEFESDDEPDAEGKSVEIENNSVTVSEDAPTVNAVYGGEYNTEVKDTYTLKTASFTDLVPGEQYVLLAITNINGNPTDSDNLLYIDQSVAEDDGTLRFQYIQRTATDISYVVACGASNKNLNNAVITFSKMIDNEEVQAVDPTVVYNDIVLTEGKDYVIVGTTCFAEAGDYICYIRGIRNYTGLVECSYTVESGTDEPVENPFTDVSESEYYYNAVLWAYENGITSGVTATSFQPDKTCTRAQTVTFLWRAMGEPEPESALNPFTDINSSEYYYNAVLWAYQNGIAAGITETTFCPDTTVTRAQVVTFLWRAEGQPEATITNPFTDVKSSEYYYDAVLWAYENGITSGATETLFKPTASCTRAQVVTFLYRDMH